MKRLSLVLAQLLLLPLSSQSTISIKIKGAQASEIVQNKNKSRVKVKFNYFLNENLLKNGSYNIWYIFKGDSTQIGRGSYKNDHLIDTCYWYGDDKNLYLKAYFVEDKSYKTFGMIYGLHTSVHDVGAIDGDLLEYSQDPYAQKPLLLKKIPFVKGRIHGKYTSIDPKHGRSTYTFVNGRLDGSYSIFSPYNDSLLIENGMINPKTTDHHMIYEGWRNKYDSKGFVEREFWKEGFLTYQEKINRKTRGVSEKKYITKTIDSSFSFYENGSIQEIYKRDDTGAHLRKSYFLNGNPKSDEYYTENKKKGHKSEFYTNGKIKTKETYSNGRKESTVFYNMAGQEVDQNHLDDDGDETKKDYWPEEAMPADDRTPQYFLKYQDPEGARFDKIPPYVENSVMIGNNLKFDMDSLTFQLNKSIKTKDRSFLKGLKTAQVKLTLVSTTGKPTNALEVQSLKILSDLKESHAEDIVELFKGIKIVYPSFHSIKNISHIDYDLTLTFKKD